MSSVKADGSVDFNEFHREQNGYSSKFTMRNGKTGFQNLKDSLKTISDKDQKPTLKYLQAKGRAAYFVSKDNGSVDKVKKSREVAQKALDGMSTKDATKAQAIDKHMSISDINMLGQSADKVLYEHKQSTLSNGMTSSQYLKKTLEPLSDKGKLFMSKFYRDEGRASYYNQKGNDEKKASYLNNAQHQLNNLSFDDTQKVPTQELTKKLDDKDWQKVGFRANRYVQHRENGWKQAQFLYQALGREGYFEDKNNDRKAKAYHQQATKEYNAMTPDNQKRAMDTYNRNSEADLSKKANLWINKHFGRNNRRSNYGHRYNNYGHNYRNNRSHSQKNFLNHVMGNKRSNYHHAQHHNITDKSQKVSVSHHEKKQPKRNSTIDKEESFRKNQNSITPSDMPF